MLYYDAIDPAPNPRRVRLYLAEKGLTVPTERVSIPKREHKSDAYRAVNPLGQVPCLQLDDGSVITESVSICRYFELLHPEPPLFGRGPQGQAEVDMWSRRVELRLMMPIGMVWLHTHPFTARVVPRQYTEFGESNRPRIDAVMREFDSALNDRDFLDGKEYSMADIVLLTTIDFGKFIGVDMPDDATALRAWHQRISARPSVAA
jgi:glutathione S-transferase